MAGKSDKLASLTTMQIQPYFDSAIIQLLWTVWQLNFNAFFVTSTNTAFVEPIRTSHVIQHSFLGLDHYYSCCTPHVQICLYLLSQITIFRWTRGQFLGLHSFILDVPWFHCIWPWGQKIWKHYLWPSSVYLNSNIHKSIWPHLWPQFHYRFLPV